jgi:hypothetical protein
MDMEMEALHQNGTWELVALLLGKKTVGCKWVYTVKFNLDGSIERLKLVWLLRVIAKRMILITMRHFLQLPKFLLFVCLFHWLLI